ncbi:hypothetical protein FLL77_11340 [Vibrio cholerae]|uniref:hypothetical protein n=1 Tax=Vibrio cholerae TaxID=666 RepID=UPI0004E39AAC|nr:hypothetical protein [Vibrio cholerae]EGR1087851.1 hypothetical protein [Vibrio cholerae]EHV1351313.1 hypothetical protein [Vibrio cholerae]EJF7232732.1 hypothetical protein [Vibrio cholerae]EJL6962628.1 hypothetical protein [Vibrio cholerae]EJL7011373.1 hypothetical protein [Vibrio cholerae]
MTKLILKFSITDEDDGQQSLSVGWQIESGENEIMNELAERVRDDVHAKLKSIIEKIDEGKTHAIH